MRIFIVLVGILWISSISMAQQNGPTNGVSEPQNQLIALINGHIVISSEEEIENGSLLFQNGIIQKVGSDISIPENAMVYDLNGKYIYPSFIELYSNYGMPKVEKNPKPKVPIYTNTRNETYYWNESIHPELDAYLDFKSNSQSAKKLLENGFGSALVHQQNGIMRGTAALVSLQKSQNKSAILSSKSAQFISYGKGNSSQLYPTSLMGCLALIRQVYYDAEWYSNSSNEQLNISLESFNNNKSLPLFVVANNHHNILRTQQWCTEFNQEFIAIGGGDEYKRILEIQEANVKLVIPLNFPKPFEVTDPYDAEYASLKDLRHWEIAPSNPSLLEKSEIPFALTSRNNTKHFLSNISRAISHGLSPEGALKALTEIPANYLGMEDKLGTLEKGKIANLLVVDGDLFREKGQILENWSQGKRHVIKDAFALNPAGEYNLNINKTTHELIIDEGSESFTVKTTLGTGKEGYQYGEINFENGVIALQFKNTPEGIASPIRMVGKLNFKGKIIDGKAQDGEGNWMEWSAIKQKKENPPSKLKEIKTIETNPHITYPNMAFGDTLTPIQKVYFIKGATIWSCDSTGVYTGNVIIENGKITQVGKDVQNMNGAEFIDGSDFHLTPGIIDEHSHIAIKRGVNEYGQNNSAEVRIGDVLNDEDINIYRQLSGGVTSAQLLHGSANPIGGQCQVIKLRWGQQAEKLKFEGNQKSIKFALGENVKQSNSDSHNSVRYPQTRMGVEQVYIDAFTRAQEYKKEWDSFNSLTSKQRKKSNTVGPHRDLELDALVEILDGKRNITCHSYIKSEIQMLMNVADSFGIKINTFTHILEGYKVADEMKKHGAHASTFSDWWAYKFEVNDAIPYNAAILSKQGIITAINSDDAEMGRRLNQEAAKTVKYGGVSEEEALKMITINPAIMLGIDQKVGSITKGKDADLVLWSGHPLSIDSHPKIVWIDGAIYYSESRSLQLMEKNQKERQELILKMIKAKEKGVPTKKIKPSNHLLYHCDTYEDEMND